MIIYISIRVGTDNSIVAVVAVAATIVRQTQWIRQNGRGTADIHIQ